LGPPVAYSGDSQAVTSGGDEDMPRRARRAVTQEFPILVIEVVVGLVGLCVFVILILVFGGLLTPPSGRPPLALWVVPASLSSGQSGVPAPPSTCILPVPPGDSPQAVALGESIVLVGVDAPPRTIVTGASVELLARRIVPDRAYAGCAALLPRYTGTMDGWQAVQLFGGELSAPIGGLQLGRTLELIVQPPRPEPVPVFYLWRINVTCRVGPVPNARQSYVLKSYVLGTIAPPSVITGRAR
jgi:hypothetical protein